jgi:hypothetical protein
MVAIEPGHAQIGLERAADDDPRSEYRAAANACATAFRHSAGYGAAADAHGHAFY